MTTQLISNQEALLQINVSPASAEPIPEAKETVEEFFITEFYATSQYPGQDWDKVSQEVSQESGSAKGYSELLVVGIVVFFVIVLIAWEAVGRSYHLRMALYRLRQSCGLIYLSSDEERAVTLGHTDPRRSLSREKKFAREEKLERWDGKPLCCSDNEPQRWTCSESNKLSTAALISNCVRGVCEV